MLYRETLHVPLILFWPAGLPRGIEVESLVSLIDVGPTILDLIGVKTAPHMEGESLLPLLQDSAVVNNRLVFSEEPWIHRGHHRSLRDGNSTLYDHGRGEVELFSVAEDPFEYEDLSLTHPELVVEMHRQLLEFITAGGLLRGDQQEEARELSSEEIGALRALGYVD